MICSELAGIPFFVTGGIGGVHKGVETSMDISKRFRRTSAYKCYSYMRRSKIYFRFA